MDYVEKPFTPDELAEFTSKLLFRRQDRIAKQTPPKVRLVTSALEQSRAPDVINVPGGIYVSDEHTWVAVEITGEARIGLDDFALKTLKGGFEIDFPQQSEKVTKGEPLFSIRRGSHSLTFTSPLSGRVTKINHELAYHLELLDRRPFAMGWICCLEASSLSADLSSLRIGADATSWYETEIERFREQLRAYREARPEAAPADEQETAPDEIEEAWVAFSAAFLTANSVPATT
jgi:glycine cleavage system H lipoate-binding protein